MKTEKLKLFFRHRFHCPLEALVAIAGFFLVGALISGCTSTIPDRKELKTASMEPPAYTLGPGDKIRVTIYDNDDLSGNFTVDDTGRISIPLVGGLNALDITIPELEQLIIEQLAGHHIIDPKVSIDLTMLRPFCILGEVRNPGCFTYVFGMTANRAIALAGGYTYRARKNELVISRGDQKFSAEHDTPVHAGDLIEVFERLF